MHISGSSIGHEQVVLPTKAMRPGEEEYAIACAVPVNAPGVSVIDTTYAPYGETDPRNFPVSGHHSSPEGFVIFDNVFVPNERIFLDGEVQQAARSHRPREWARTAACCTSPLYISALKYHKNEFHSKLLDILHDIAGTLTVNAPTFADFEHPDLHNGLDAMLSTSTLSATQRLRLFHHLRDTTADAYGGRAFATGQLSGGGQHAQRLVTMRHFDMQHAKSLARRILEPAANERQQQNVTAST